MYAIVETAGFQQKVALGQTIRIPTNQGDVGSEVEFKSVLLFTNGSEVKVGTPVVEESLVKGEILAHGREKKVIVYKKKRRQGYENKNGHRQGFTEVIITEIKSGSESSVVDGQLVTRARARAIALAAQKVTPVKPTRKEKIAAGIPKAPKVKKNAARNS